MDYTTLQQWRMSLYATMTRGSAVLMNILDALLTAPTARHAIDLTLTPAFARRWPSFYQGLQDGRLHRAALRRLYCATLPWTPGERLLLILDTSSILRPQSPTARDRMAVHTAADTGDRPVGVGWQFSLLVVAPPTPSSWGVVLDGTRVRTGTTPARLGACQVASVRPQLPTRPLLLGDRYYGSQTFVLDSRLQDCDLLVRLQTHRVFYRQPPARDPHRRGQPPKRGARFQPKDPTTHGPPNATWTGVDARGRPVTVRAWTGLAWAAAMDQPLTVLECARQDGPDTKADPRVVWLLWRGAGEAPLAEIPTLYGRRFSIEHLIRFAKQDLLWAEPRLRTPGQFQRWTDLVFAAHNTLVRARSVVAGIRLPWERAADRPVTPPQVRRALGGILPTLGTPAPPPQPRGKSPGRAPGQRPHPAPRYAVVRKSRAPTTAAPPIPP